MLKILMGTALLLMASMSVHAAPDYEREGYSLYLAPGTGTFTDNKIELQLGSQYQRTAYAFDAFDFNDSLGDFALILQPGYVLKSITAGISGSYEVNGIEVDGLYAVNAIFNPNLVAYRSTNIAQEVPSYVYALGAYFDTTILGDAGYPSVSAGPITNQHKLGFWDDLRLFRAFTGELQLSGLVLNFPSINTSSYTTLSIDSAYLEFEVVSSVPEPEMQGMMLAGLGMLAFSTRRRITTA